MVDKWSHIQFSFESCIMFETFVGKLYSLIYVYVHLKIWNTSKEAFITNAVKIILANWHLYTQQYTQLAHNVTTHYQNVNGLFNDCSSSSENEST
jgi:hypothetical protein